MDQLVLLVIIGLISLVNWVMQKAAEKRELAKLERGEREAGQPSVYRQPPPPKQRTAERRARAPQQDPLKELMEALGLPPEAVAPQPVAPRVEVETEEFASLESAPPPVPQPAPAASKPRWQPPSIRRPDEKAAKLAAAFAAKEKSPAEKARPASVRGLLSDRTSKRHAVVLAEILGPPRGLAPAGGRW